MLRDLLEGATDNEENDGDMKPKWIIRKQLSVDRKKNKDNL